MEVSDETRIIVSEPIVDLPGAWNEVPESSYGVIQEERMSCTSSGLDEESGGCVLLVASSGKACPHCGLSGGAWLEILCEIGACQTP